METKRSDQTDMLTSEQIRTQALALGWDDVGIARAQIPEADIQAYRTWLSHHYHGDLAYMENQIRCDPQQLLPNAQSAILFITYYKQPSVSIESRQGLIASYARGRDYHHVHRKRLKKFIQWLEMQTGQRGIARGFSDSAPLLEKALAVQAGLGWFGKNTLLIHRRFGTFTLLSGVLTTLKLSPSILDLRLPKCGSCTRCLDACPTQAFVAPYQLDATKCLSYHLIESKKPIPEEIQQQNPGYIFGCDICQNVCPHNWRKPEATTPDFQPEKGIGISLNAEQLEKIEKQPEKLFGTPLQRRGIQGLKHTFDTLDFFRNSL